MDYPYLVMLGPVLYLTLTLHQHQSGGLAAVAFVYHTLDVRKGKKEIKERQGFHP